MDHSALLLRCLVALWRVESRGSKSVADGRDEDAEGEKGSLANRALVVRFPLGPP